MAQTDKSGNWFERALGWLTQAVSAPTAVAPKGQEFAALAIKTQTQDAVYDDDRQAIDALVKGTISTCINARAQERGAVKFKVTASPEALQSRLQKVLDHPNPVQSSYDFWENCSQFHDTTGNGVIYFVRDKDELPAEMYIIPSYYLVAIFEEASDVIPSAYRWADGRVITDTENLCIVRSNNVKTAPYVGRGFIGDQIDLATLYDQVLKAQLNFFATGGAPNIALVQPVGSILGAQQIKDMQQMWATKYNPATGTSNIAVLPDGVVPHDFGPQELNYTASKQEIRDGIREALQTPKVILGDTDNVNLNNGQTALAIFDRTIVLRWAEKVASALEHYFCVNYTDGIKVEVDEKLIKGLQQLQLERMTDNPNADTLPSRPRNEAV